MNLLLDQELLDVLKYVYVNMPWKLLHQYRETILRTAMNVEIGTAAEDLDGASLSEVRDAADALRERGCGITMHGPFWDLCPGSLDPLIRQTSLHRLRQLFDFMEPFDPVQVVCHTGYDPRHHISHRSVWVEHSLAIWEPLVLEAERRKIPLLLENVWEEDPGLHAELFEHIDSPYLGFCLDVGHQHTFSTTPLVTWLHALSDRLQEIHLHDNDGTRDAHLPVGRGSVKFKLLFDFLAENGKNPLLTLEPHTEEHLTESLQGLRSFVCEREHRVWPS